MEDRNSGALNSVGTGNTLSLSPSPAPVAVSPRARDRGREHSRLHLGRRRQIRLLHYDFIREARKTRVKTDGEEAGSIECAE